MVRNPYEQPHGRRALRTAWRRVALAVVVSAVVGSGSALAVAASPAGVSRVRPTAHTTTTPTTTTPTTTTPSAVAGLDATGTTVPVTDLPIPAGAVFMSPTGSDAAPGTLAAPVLTLARAYALTPSGGTIVARGGTYHDGSLVETRRVTLQAYPGEAPWFDGSNPVTSWTSDGAGHWYVAWSTPDFCENPANPSGGYYSQVWPWQGTPSVLGPCQHYDMTGDPAGPAAGDPQMVFDNGVNVREVTSLAQVTASSFYYDFGQRRVYIGVDPTGRALEVTKHPDAVLILDPSTGGNSILGIGFRGYASNEKNEGSATHGAVTIQATPGVTIADDVFTQNAGAALNLMGAPNRGATIDHDVFAFNGFNGVDGNGSENADDLTIENSIFNANNASLFGLHCSASCSAAGSKLAHMDTFTIRDNVFENGAGEASGFWCDLHCSHATIVGNVVTGNGDVGIFYEVSDTGLIASNLVVGNGTYLEAVRPNGTGNDNSDKGSGIRVSAANTQIVDNTMSGNVADLVVYDDSRSPGAACGGCSVTDVGPDTRNDTVVDNVFGPVSPVAGMDSWLVGVFREDLHDGTPGTAPSQFFAAFDDNSYLRPLSQPAKLVWWDPDASNGNSPSTMANAFGSVAAFRSGTGLEAAGLDVNSSLAPVFIWSGGANYCVRAGSPAGSHGAPLAASVAAAAGLPASATGRGAPGWLGRSCGAGAGTTAAVMLRNMRFIHPPA